MRGGKEEMFETAIEALIGLIEAGIIVSGSTVFVLVIEKIFKKLKE